MHQDVKLCTGSKTAASWRLQWYFKNFRINNSHDRGACDRQNAEPVMEVQQIDQVCTPGNAWLHPSCLDLVCDHKLELAVSVQLQC